MASFIPNPFKLKAYDATTKINLAAGGDTIKVALTTSSYTPSQDNHDFFDDVTNEISGTGYTAGGATLANQTYTQDSGNDLAKFDADDVSWAASTITARYAVIYKSTGTASTSPLIAIIDLGGNITTVSSTFTLNWNSSGILTLT